MTAAEQQISFKFGMDKFDSLNYPNFRPNEIDLLLNQSQDRIIKQRYGSTNAKKQSFEETQKRTDDLKNVVKTVILTPLANQAINKPNGLFVQLPVDYWFALNEECNLQYTDCHNEIVTARIPVRPIQHDDYNKTIKDPFNKPWEEEIVRLESDTYVELITADNQTVQSYYLRYIKRPVRIDSVSIPNVNCELSEHTHQEIVDEAIKIALEGIEARRQQTFNNIENTNE